MDEHQLLHDCFMPDKEKDEYLKKTKFQIQLHAYPGSYLKFSIYPSNTGLYLILVDYIFLQVVFTVVPRKVR